MKEAATSDESMPLKKASGSAHSNSSTERGNDFTGLVLLIGAIVALGLLAGWSWAIVVLAIIFMIFMHELGHYATAKWTGMKVTEFFIGFGPRLWSFRRGETEYGVKGIPAGAYVRISGMNNLDEVEPGDEDRAYRVKSFPRRLLVVSAGSAMHFMMAIVLLFFLVTVYGVGAEDGNWVIGSVSDASAAAALELEPGDEVISVDGIEITDFITFGELISERGGESVEVVWARDGDIFTESTVLGARLTPEGAEGLHGLIPRDRVLTVDGADIFSWEDFVAATEGRIGEPIEVIVDPARELEPRVLIMTVDVLAPADVATTGFFGVSQEPARDKLGAVSGVSRSVEEFAGLIEGATTGLIRFFTPGTLSNFLTDTIDGTSDLTTETGVAEDREVASRALDIRNPDEDRILSIYGAARAGASFDTEQLLFFLAALNVFVGVFNLVPLPPLDGGHIAVAIYERLRSFGGRRHEVDYAKLLPLTYTVFAVLMVIGMFALFRDIIDPVDLG